MAPPRVLFATYQHQPELCYGEELVLPELASLGVTGVAAVWDDAAVDWAADLVVIRSTWDYHAGRRAEFVAWADRVETRSPLANCAAVVRDNTDKRYLERLAAAGVPVTPTVWLDGSEPPDLDGILADRGWGEAVVKPTISAGAMDTVRFGASRCAEAQQLAGRLLTAGREVMVQPYLQSVESYGERSLIFFDRELSHAVRRPARLDGATVDGDGASPVRAADDELEVARQALGAIDAALLYARVDLARLEDGTPVLMELELTEPHLFLGHADDAAGRFAAAIARRL